MWIINAKYRLALELLKHWGYDLIDEVVWVKQTVNRRLAKSHGYYLQHAKETCLVAKIGSTPKHFTPGGSDVIWSERRGQSQKPEEIYELIVRNISLLWTILFLVLIDLWHLFLFWISSTLR